MRGLAVVLKLAGEARQVNWFCLSPFRVQRWKCLCCGQLSGGDRISHSKGCVWSTVSVREDRKELPLVQNLVQIKDFSAF